MEIIAQNAALYNTTGNRRIGKDTVIVLSSVTGTTQEVVAAVEKAKAQGAVVIGFVDTADTPLEKLSDYAIPAVQWAVGAGVINGQRNS